MSVRWWGRLLGAAALLVGAAVPLGLAPAPAEAAGACAPPGVTVVVDFGKLGGGVQQSCAPGGGSARTLFEGHSLTTVRSAPGAVCSIDSKPADPCGQMPPANAYWALFWTDGSQATWTYASLGVDSLTVPAGGSVGFAWQSAAGTRAPGVKPPVTAAAPGNHTKPGKAKPVKAHPKPTKKRATKPSATPTPTAPATAPPAASPSVSSGASAGASPSSMASPSAKAKHSHRRSSATPAPGAASPTPPAASPEPAAGSTDSAPVSADADGGGLPGWVAPVVVVAVLAAGAGVVARRRLRG